VSGPRFPIVTPLFQASADVPSAARIWSMAPSVAAQNVSNLAEMRFVVTFQYEV
jgi:hypothetical protein